MNLVRTGAAVCAIAAMTACSNNASNDRIGNSNATPADRSVAADRTTGTDSAAAQNKQAPITVSGCLQKGGSNFILTRVNEPTQSVGTSGTNTGVAEREQMRSAAGAYRIDPTGDVKLDELVGKEIRVVGTVAENADLPKPSNDHAAGTSGDNSDRRNRDEVKAGDLTKIDATSVTTVADACRGAESGKGAGTQRQGSRRQGAASRQ